MALAPLALLLMTKGKSWIIIAASIISWAGLRGIEATLPFSSWQLLFFFGMIAGYYYPAVQRWSHTITKTWRTSIKAAITTIALTSFIFSLICFELIPAASSFLPSSIVHGAELIQASITPFSDKATLGVIRIIFSLIWFTGLFFILRRYENNYPRIQRFFSTLGKNSLYVYCWHGFILVLIGTFLKPDDGSQSLVLSTIVAALVLALIYLLTYYKSAIQSLFRFPSRDKDVSTT